MTIQLSGDLSAALTEARERIKRAQDEVRDLCKKAFSEGTQAIFADPSVINVSWRQYTPYFNDGEECVFGLHGVTVNGREPSDYNDKWYDWDDDDGPLGTPLPKPPIETGREIIRFIESFNDDQQTLKMMFGDHVKVTLTRDGVDIEEYQHD